MCHDVDVEPELHQLAGEILCGNPGNTKGNAIVDMSRMGFYQNCSEKLLKCDSILPKRRI